MLLRYKFIILTSNINCAPLFSFGEQYSYFPLKLYLQMRIPCLPLDKQPSSSSMVIETPGMRREIASRENIVKHLQQYA